MNWSIIKDSKELDKKDYDCKDYDKNKAAKDVYLWVKKQ